MVVQTFRSSSNVLKVISLMMLIFLVWAFALSCLPVWQFQGKWMRVAYASWNVTFANWEIPLRSAKVRANIQSRCSSLGQWSYGIDAKGLLTNLWRTHSLHVHCMFLFDWLDFHCVGTSGCQPHIFWVPKCFSLLCCVHTVGQPRATSFG